MENLCHGSIDHEFKTMIYFFFSLQGMFYKKMLILLLHLLTMSMAIYSRPPFKDGLMNGFKAGEDAPEMTEIDIMRYIFTV